jgi:predicted CoA-binding protein
MPDVHANLIDSADRARDILARAKRIAILGIKPEERAYKAAFYVSRYLLDAGYDVVPVPVYYPELTEILDRPVYRRVADVPGPIDLVVVFRRSGDIPPHVDDLIAAGPKAVWFQLGIRNEEAARRLAEAGIEVVQDRCTMIEHRRI